MKDTHRFKKEKSRRGIYILPNIFTSINLFFGFYAVIASINGKFVAGSVAILIGVMFDILDGKIARATNTTSKFGIEYDSLADLVSFGLAPGLMIYLWALKPLGRLGWLAGFLFMACGALRLARFNSQVGTVSSDYFVGLPIPAGAGMAATTVLFCHKFGIAGKVNPILILVMLYTLSFLMVSTIKYNSFKKPELFRKMNFNVLVAAILILIFIAAQPSIALFLLGLAYVTSGPFVAIRQYKKARRKKTEDLKAEDHSSSPV
ncbi:MAG: CDP-diacylglycerol--serine O-phosphatidyltransferase [Deltaproteobacteria bacterium]|nr:CDP-diacylglycerol--serine O-phosphatidyltransferase [Deltaproteobacteria bacterium]MBW2192222.1 CDP-diacylglycerol--serine O-phosphatidyltransferase [Deltaproteobacteria bacterium]